MKKVMIYLTIGFLSTIIACEEDKSIEPIEWLHYFAFVDGSDNDFFLDNPEYSSVKLYYPLDQTSQPFVDSVNIDNMAIFGHAAWAWSTHYFSFENGDIDTLTKTWIPASIRLSSFDEVETMSFFYNGKFVEKWDFIQDPELRINLKKRNRHSIAHPTATNPIYIKLPKNPNPGEFY